MIHEIFVATKILVLLNTMSFFDEPLHPDIQRAVREPRELVSDVDNSHVYLMGIMARSSEEALSLGKKRLLSSSETHSNGERQAYKTLPEGKWTQLNKEPNICLVRTDGEGYKEAQEECFDKVYRSCSNQSYLLDTYSHTISIFNEAIRKEAAVSLSDKGLFDWDTIEFIRRANTLDNVRITYSLNCAAHEINISSIQSEVAYKQKMLRNLYAQTDDLTLKIALLLILKENFIWLVHENGRQNLARNNEQLFSLQSLNELSHRKIHNRTIRDMMTYSDELKNQAVIESGDAGLLIGMLYKDNRTTNRTLLGYVNAIKDSELYPHEYADLSINKTYDYRFRWWKIGNFLGEILSSVSAARFVDLSLDFKSLDLYIRLSDIMINHRNLVTEENLDQIPESKRNPYDFSLPYFDPSRSWLCFNEPKEISRNEYCLKIP